MPCLLLQLRYILQSSYYTFVIGLLFKTSHGLFMNVNAHNNTMIYTSKPGARVTQLLSNVPIYSLYCLSAMSAAQNHYKDVIMSAMAYPITSLTMVYSTVYSRRRSKKHQGSASLAYVRGIHRWPVNSPHKWPVTRNMFPFDYVIM